MGNLEALLASSHKYPPARALTAEALEDSQLDWPALAARLEQLLTHYFEGQATLGFRLLKRLKDQGDSLEIGGYGGVGHFDWALAAADGRIAWASDVDYFIHWSPLEEFDLPAGCVLPAALPEIGP